MGIVVISGSSRPGSQSRKVADWVVKKLQDLGAETELIDMHETVLPIDTDVLKLKEQPELWAKWDPTREKLDKAEGYVIVSPEWDGMVPPALMNLLLFASEGGKPMAHKPVQVVSASSGRGGAYPIAQLRSFGHKNNHLVYIPHYVPIRQVETVLNSPTPEADNKSDSYYQAAIEYALKILLVYADAFLPIRESNVIDLKKYASGN